MTDQRYADGPNVGDILFYDVGWSMVLPHFAYVTKRTPCTFECVQLPNRNVSRDGGWTGSCVPETTEPTAEYLDNGPRYRNRVRSNGTIYVGGHYATIWDGQPKWFDYMD